MPIIKEINKTFASLYVLKDNPT